jgi:hypothetical protein
LSIFCRGEAKSRAVEEFMLYREEGYFFKKTTQWAKNVHEDIFDIHAVCFIRNMTLKKVGRFFS